MEQDPYPILTHFTNKRTGGFSMGYTREERLDIGKQLYNNEISRQDAVETYGISTSTARDYMRLYRDTNHLPPKNKAHTDGRTTRISTHSPAQALSEYESMTKEELIKELVTARIREARLKKGYEVKGVGAEKTITVFDSRNTKS